MKKTTTERFIEKSKAIYNNKFDYSKVNYINAQTKIKIICLKHGEFEILPYNHLRGNGGCRLCSAEKQKNNFSKTTEQFIKDAINKYSDKYDYSLTNYINNKTKVKIICPIHGAFFVYPRNFLESKSCGCKKCSNEEIAKRYAKTTEQFIEKAKEIHGDKYDYSLADYIRTNIKLKIICPKHGIFEQTPKAHLNNEGCPKCKSSRGEIKIRNYLKSKYILFEEQKRFKECKDKRSLPFDFYLPNENLLIEFQGEQHYRPHNFKRSKYNFEQLKKHDNIKKEFAVNNGFCFLEISYKDNIEDILKENL